MKLSLLFFGWKKAYNDFHVKAINDSSVQLFVKALLGCDASTGHSETRQS